MGLHSVSLQTVSSICQTLDGVLKIGFGPNGRFTLLTTSTGQVLITNVGISILDCLHIGNPIGQLITRSTAKCQQFTGDGSKTFILYLTGIFSYLSNGDWNDSISSRVECRNKLAAACQYVHRSLFENVCWPAARSVCVTVDFRKDPSAAVEVMIDLVRTHLSGKYSATTSAQLARTLVEFVCTQLDDFDRLPAAVEVCHDNFQLLCVEAEGKLPSSTFAVKGIIVRTDFLFIDSSLSISSSPAKFVLIHLSFNKSNDVTDLRTVFQASNQTALYAAIDWKTKNCSLLVDWLVKHNVNVVLSSLPINEILNGLCAAAGISTVQFVDEEELSRISATFGIDVIDSMSALFVGQSSSVIGLSEHCEPRIIGRKRYVYLGPPSSANKYNAGAEQDAANGRCGKTVCPVRQLVVYGMSAGACRQASINLLNSVKVLRAWLEGGRFLEEHPFVLSTTIESASSRCAVHVPGGGLFEMSIKHALKKYLKESRRSDPDHLGESVHIVCAALCASMTAVPLRLLQNSYRPQSASTAHLERLAGTGQSVIAVDGRTGKQLETSCGVIEPLANKLHVFNGVLALTAQLLRIDCILGVKRLCQVQTD